MARTSERASRPLLHRIRNNHNGTARRLLRHPSTASIRVFPVDNRDSGLQPVERNLNTTDASFERWDSVLCGLESLYRDVMRRCLALPAFKLRPRRPTQPSYRENRKVMLFLLFDLFLLPVNFVVGVRNLLPGRWPYRWFSANYWRNVAGFLGRGEIPWSFGVMRPLVSFMITIHAHNRLRLLPQRIYLDDTLGEEARLELQKRADDVLEHWKRPSIAQIVYSYALPFSAPLAAAFKLLFGGQGPPLELSLPLGMLVFLYAISCAVSAFACKRALMLGGAGPVAYFPDEIAGNGGYAEETVLLGRVGIRVKEFPFDMVCFWLNAGVTPMYCAQALRLRWVTMDDMTMFCFYFLAATLIPFGLITGYRRMVGDRR